MTMSTTSDPINYQRIEKAIEYLEEHFHEQPNLDDVAEKVHLSPFHFQRIFSEWAGISPKRFLQSLTVNFLKKKLQGSTVLDAAESAGLSAQSRVYDLFTTLEAVTPQEYKTSGAGIQIDYGFQETRFGLCLIGITARGICWLSFLNPDEDGKGALDAMKEHWHNSIFRENNSLALAMTEKIFGDGDQNKNSKLHLFVKGTNFQVKVWQALLAVPTGEITTYQKIAESIENANALQAVGSAAGANHIAYIIPCHRCIRKDGILGDYRWGSTRKKAIIGWELAKTNK